MVILGLGTNLGHCLDNLRDALDAIAKIPTLSIKQVSPVYLSDALLPENAPLAWHSPHFNVAVRCETALSPEMLLEAIKTIEKDMGRQSVAGMRWSPRIIDIDILVFDDCQYNTQTLTIPHKSLLERPFALWPLSDVAPFWVYPVPGQNQGKTASQLVEPWGSRFTGDAPLHTRQINQRIDTPKLVGILNVTPDSFSDGGHFVMVEKAIAHARTLVNNGAEIIDIGAESTSPRAEAINPDIEWSRLEHIVKGLLASRSGFIIPPKISVDTRHAEVAKKALHFGVDWINDVTGLDDKAMREIVSHSKADCVVMHHLSIPERRDHVLPRHQDVVGLVCEWGAKRLDELEKQGIARERIIFDPGVGFGKMAEQSLVLLKNISAFSKLNTRLLIGHSRKTFFSLLSKFPFAERDIETLTLSLNLINQVDYLRVHNVEMCARGFRVSKAFD